MERALDEWNSFVTFRHFLCYRVCVVRTAWVKGNFAKYLDNFSAAKLMTFDEVFVIHFIVLFRSLYALESI